jgi:hypothetical protein
MNKRTWNVSGTCSIELAIEEGELIAAASEQPIPEFLFPYLDMTFAEDGSGAFHWGMMTCEIIIDFRAKGYELPASMYGGPDRMGWDREGDEERLLDEVYLWVDDDRKVYLPKDIQQKVFDHYEDDVENTDPEGK